MPLSFTLTHHIWTTTPPTQSGNPLDPIPQQLSQQNSHNLLTTRKIKSEKQIEKNERKQKVRNLERQNRKKVTQDKPHRTKADNLSPEFAFHTEDKSPLHKTHNSKKRISTQIIAVPLEMKQAWSTSRTEKVPNNETRTAGLLPQWECVPIPAT